MSKFLKKYQPKDSAWTIEEDTRPGKMNFHEALFTQANGYLGMRGINEDIPKGGRPGTYLAGIFDKSECVSIEWVNLPNPLPFYFLLDGKKVDISSAQLRSHCRMLNLKDGSLFRETIFQTGKRLTRFRSIRFVSSKDTNSAAVKVEITPLNYSDEVRIVSEIDASTTNAFGSYFPDEKIKHYCLSSINDNFEEETFLKVKTRDRREAIGFLTYLDARAAGKFRRIKKVVGEKVVEEIGYQAKKGKPAEFIKYISVLDSRDCHEEDLRKRLTTLLARNRRKGFDGLFRENKIAWDEKWQRADVSVEGCARGDDTLLNRRIRFNIYHLLMNGSTIRVDHGIGIKGFTGEMYRGHYFWDTEIYMFPFYLYTNPKIARNLLLFRHSTLAKARENARSRGFKGALFVWESDNEGNEGINPDINRLTGDKRRRETLDQLHINLDVIYAMFSYFKATEDIDFMASYGAEILIENLRFWVSKLEYNKKLDRYETKNIMGPDEYHANLDNNYYTNYLLQSVIGESLKFLEELRKRRRGGYYRLVRKLKVKAAEPIRWQKLEGKIYLPPPRKGVLEQFSGYFKLKDYKIRRYNEFGIPVIEELEKLKDPSHPDYTPTLTHYNEALVKFARKATLIKQADTLLILNLFPRHFPEEIKRSTLLYYEPRTLHYSSLSPGVYALCAARLGEKRLARKHFNLALMMDLSDIKKESARALHTPTSGEVYTILTAGFAGLSANGDILELDPHLPEGWKAINFSFLWKGVTLEFRVGTKGVRVKSSGRRSVTLSLRGEERRIKPKKLYQFPL